MESVWDAWKLDLEDESSWSSCRRSRCPGRRTGRRDQPGVRGAAPLPAPAAATAAAADDLRDVDAGQPGDRRVLPRAAAGGDPESRAGPADHDLGRGLLRSAAQPEAARAAPVAREIAAQIPNRSRCHLSPTTHLARTRPRSDPRHSHVRRGPAARGPRQQDGMPTALRRVRCSASARCRRPAQPRRGDRCDRRDVDGPADDQPGDHQDERGRLGCRQRAGRPAGVVDLA